MTLAAVGCWASYIMASKHTSGLFPPLSKLDAYLGVGHVHPGGVEPVFDLLPVVHLQQVVAAELHLRQLLGLRPARLQRRHDGLDSLGLLQQTPVS